MKCTWIAPKKIKKSPSPHSKMKTQWNSHKWCYLQPSSPILTVFLGPPKNSVLQGLVSLLHGLFILMFCLSQQLAPFGIRTRFPKWLPVTNNATYKHGTGRSKYLSGVSNGYIYIWHIHWYTMAPKTSDFLQVCPGQIWGCLQHRTSKQPQQPIVLWHSPRSVVYLHWHWC